MAFSVQTIKAIHEPSGSPGKDPRTAQVMAVDSAGLNLCDFALFAKTQRVLDIIVRGWSAPLLPGTYPIVENAIVADGGATVVFYDRPDGGVLPQTWRAASGTVTVSSVGRNAVAGSFDVVMAPSPPDGGPSVPASGSFAANMPVCP